MTNKTTYLTKYCNLVFEWNSMGINIDNADEFQQAQIKALRTKAMEQSGLTHNELALIAICREYKIFRKVNTYAYKLIELLS